MATPIIGDLIEGLLKNTAGKVVGALVDKYLPPSMSESERATFKLQMQEGIRDTLKIDAGALESVNATMRAEARSDKWWQSGWRPTVGFTFAAVILNNYVIMAYMGEWAKPIEIPGGVWNAMLVVLGAAAATRGGEKIAERWGLIKKGA